MIDLMMKTKGDKIPDGKAKIFLSGQKNDVKKYMDVICDDIFKSMDCVVYYDKGCQEGFDDENMQVLREVQMVVFIISWDFLLDEVCRARDLEYKFVVENHIPVLPICVEGGVLTVFANRMERIGKGFGAIQAIDRTSADGTKVPYEKTLQNRLEGILVGNEVASRVRAAFDAYIFLSYRKKDRVYANELMRMIHRIPGCSDIAIWYDEYLVPGEKWNDAIADALEKSSLVTMAITPSMLEKPNYVEEHEYKDALAKNKNVIPVELVSTDYEKLREVFPGIAPTIDGNDMNALAEALKAIAVTENNSTPEHKYLIGLAYLNGIDVEIDIEKGVELITKAAEAGLLEATDKLYHMYYEGNHVRIDTAAAFEWLRKSIQICEREKGGTHRDTLERKRSLAELYRSVHDYSKALEILEELYNAYLNDPKEGKTGDNTLKTKNAIARIYIGKGESSKALEMNLEILACHEEKNQLDTPDVATIYNNIGICLSNMKRYDEAIVYGRKEYEIRRKYQGKLDWRTFRCAMNLAMDLDNKMDMLDERHELLLEAYEIGMAACGVKDATTGDCARELAMSHFLRGEYTEGVELYMNHKDAVKKATNGKIVNVGFLSTTVHQFLGVRSRKGADAARRICEAVIAYEKREYKTISKDTLNLYSEVLILYIEGNEPEIAEEIARKLIEEGEREYGHEDVSVKNYHNLFSMVLMLLGRNDEAIKHYQRKSLTVSADGAKENGILHDSLELAVDAFLNGGEVAKAENLCAAISEDDMRLYGYICQVTIHCYLKIILFVFRQREEKKAYDMCKWLVKTTEKGYGADSLTAMSVRDNFAGLCAQMGDYRKAIKIWEEIYEGRCKKLGVNSPEAIAALYQIADNLFSRGKYSEALRTCNSCIRQVGVSNPAAQGVLELMVHCLIRRNNFSDALVYCKILYELKRKELGEQDEGTVQVKKILDYICDKVNQMK